MGRPLRRPAPAQHWTHPSISVECPERFGATCRLVAGIVVVATGVVLLVSLLSPVQYRASARIADEPLAAGTADSADTDRRLATSRELATTPGVLAAAAQQLRGETAEALAGKVSATRRSGDQHP